MDKLDLNIKNYELEDILNLFKVPSNLNIDHLKEAKKIVLKTHPDKSGLHPDYFRFFSKAYKVLYNIWEFKNKQEKEVIKIDYDSNIDNDMIIDKGKIKILDGYLKKEKIPSSNNQNSQMKITPID